MSQHDYDIANQTAPNFRSDLNDALEAVVTNNSGSTEPSVTYANQWWYDTSSSILKIRSEADDAWINVGYLDQSTNEFKPYIGSTQITDFLDEDDMSSDSATAVPSQQSVKAFVDDKVFESSEITIPSSGLVSASHGFGSTPRFARAVLRCKTASNGFSVGDETIFGIDSGGEEGPAPSVHTNSTDCFLFIGASNYIRVNRPDNGNWDGVTESNYKLVFYAYK